eukprot:6391076-Amphidinium_carterae.1
MDMHTVATNASMLQANAIADAIRTHVGRPYQLANMMISHRHTESADVWVSHCRSCDSKIPPLAGCHCLSLTPKN